MCATRPGCCFQIVCGWWFILAFAPALHAAEFAFPRFPSDNEVAYSRALPGPIPPLGGGSRLSARAENRALADALLDYYRRHDPEDLRPLTRFLDEHPGSRYEASLL